MLKLSEFAIVNLRATILQYNENHFYNKIDIASNLFCECWRLIFELCNFKTKCTFVLSFLYYELLFSLKENTAWKNIKIV